MGRGSGRTGAVSDPTSVAVVIAFRDRGRDPLRAANLKRVLTHWERSDFPVVVVSDGRCGDDQFNRSAAYNLGADSTDADVLVYAESDMLVDLAQIGAAVKLASESPSLVVPFTEYHYLSESDSADVRNGADPADYVPEFSRINGESIGAVNVLSRATLGAVGRWDETFEGSWYDDTAMRIAFDVCAGPTRWVDGPGYHLYHLPGWTGGHLTAEDSAATEANRARLELYKQAQTSADIRTLTLGAIACA